MLRLKVSALILISMCITAFLADTPVKAGIFHDSLCGKKTGCGDNCCDYVNSCCDNTCEAPSCMPGDSCVDECCDLGCGGHCHLSGLSSVLSGGLIKKSDHCFDDFISPMINPLFFEDPRTLTEVRPLFIHHNVPDLIGNNITAGGSIQVYAMQARLALTDKLSLIAVKDGYIVDNTAGTLGTILSDGFADITAGLKYNLIRDPGYGTIVSAGATYEIPIGSTQALQDVGDGEFHFFLTGGQRLLDGDAHILSSFGWRQPVDSSVQSTSLHLSNHADVRITDSIYLVSELAWWHWVDDADNGVGAPLGVAGQDAFNLSVSDVSGNNLVTSGIGFKVKPSGNMELGFLYEFPLTNFEDVIDQRYTIDLILRY